MKHALARLFPALVIGSLGLVVGATPSSAQTDLRWKFEKGQVLRYEFAQTSSSTSLIDAREQKATNGLTIGFTWTVGDVAADGSADVVQTVDYVRVTIASTDAEGQSQNISFDSAGKSDDSPASQALKTLYEKVIGAEYALKVDARGQIVSVKVPEAVVASMQGSPFAAVADGGSVFSEAGVRNLLSQVMPRLPEQPVDKDGTWETTLDLPAGPLEMTLTTRYSIAELQAERATLKASIDTAIKPKDAASVKLEVPMQSGAASFVLEPVGRLASSELEQSFEMKLGVMDRSIVQKVALKATLKSREK